MKKILTSSIILAALAGISSAAPDQSSQGVYTDPSTIITPPESSTSVGFTVDGSYMLNLESEGIDCYGGRISFDFYTIPTKRLQHQFSLSVGYYTGSDEEEGLVKTTQYHDAYSSSEYIGDGSYLNTYVPAGNFTSYKDGTVETEVTQIPITLGYTLNIKLSDSVTLAPSTRIGYYKSNVTCDAYDIDEDDSGFHWAAGLALKFHVSESAFIQTGVEFGLWDAGDDSDVAKTLNFSLGLGWQF